MVAEDSMFILLLLLVLLLIIMIIIILSYTMLSSTWCVFLNKCVFNQINHLHAFSIGSAPCVAILVLRILWEYWRHRLHESSSAPPSLPPRLVF